MNQFEKKVLKFIRDNSMISEGDRILAGFSGGADSTALVSVLLELKNELGISLAAVHVNHGIRREAKADADFAENFCRERGIEFFVVSEDVPSYSRQNKLTEEEAGRQIRYRAFSAIAEKNNFSKIAVAHHQNDAAETFLLNLFRGAGVHGAGGIRPVRDNIIRPLLCVSRQEIEAYLSEKNIEYCTDATNYENIHTRNRLRNVVIPYIQENINKEATEHIYRATRYFAQADEYIENAANKVLERISEKIGDGVELKLEYFDTEPEIIKRYVILKCFEELTPRRKDITAAHVDTVLELAKSKAGTAGLNLPYDIEAVRAYSRLTIKRRGKAPGKGIDEFFSIKKFEIGDKYNLNIPALGIANIEVMAYNVEAAIPRDTYTKWLDCDRIQEVVFRHRRPDDYICIEQEGAIRKKKLSKLMTDIKVPRDIRDEIYILADGSHCLWVPGYRMSCSCKVSKKTQKVLAINIDNGGKNRG